jgi:hypothetical protein
MDGAAQRRMFQKIKLLEVAGAIGAQGAGVVRTGGDDGNLLGQADLNHVARFAAFHEAQDAARDEPADCPAHGVAAETDTPSEPGNGKPELKFSFQAAVTEKMSIDDAIGSGQAETRREVLELFPHPFGVGFFVSHGFDPRRELQSIKGHGFSRAERKLALKEKRPGKRRGAVFYETYYTRFSHLVKENLYFLMAHVSVEYRIGCVRSGHPSNRSMKQQSSGVKPLLHNQTL